MERCAKCNTPTNQTYFCPECGKEICNSCYVRSHNKCPECNHPHMIKKGGIEDRNREE